MGTLVTTALALQAAALPAARAQEAPPPPAPSFRASGESLWNLRYAWGDAAGLLGQEGYGLRRLTFEQELRLRVEGDVAPGVTVGADLDNVRSENLQIIGIDLRWGPLLAHFGDIRLESTSPYAAGRATVKGASLTAGLGAWELGITVGRARGIPASKTFYGRSSEETLRLLGEWAGGLPPYAPVRDGPVLVSDVRGSLGLPLSDVFDPDFTRVWLMPREWPTPDPDLPCDPGGGQPEWPGEDPAGTSLKEVLTANGLGVLYHDAQDPLSQGVLHPWTGTEDPELAFFRMAPGQFVGFATPGETPDKGYVLLRLESLDLVRAQLEALIRRYNELNGLTGEVRLSYPFVRGTPAESAFLEVLRRYFKLQVGVGQYPEAALDPGFRPASGDPIALNVVARCPQFRERLGSRNSEGVPGADAPLYVLGQSGIAPETLEVSVITAVGTTEPAADHGLTRTVFAEEGVLRARFAGTVEAFLAGGFRGLQVRYRFASSEGIYSLGISVAAGSERVYVNGTLLTRDVDYVIDYETGVLMLLREVRPADEIKVDFEYFRGGLGAAAEYNRNMLALRAAWSPGGRWQLVSELLFEGDEPQPLVEPDRARTMPNQHWVGAISWRYGAHPGGSPPAATAAGTGGSTPEDRGLWASIDAAYSHDVFPFDHNRRDPQMNRVEALTGGRGPLGGTAGTLLVVGHRAGVTVGTGEPGQSDPNRWTWATYSAPAVGAVSVRSLAPALRGTVSDGSLPASASPLLDSPPGAWLIGTESGLTMVANSAGPGSNTPFDLAANWETRTAAHGLPSNLVRAVLYAGVPTTPPGAAGVTEESVWVATDRGVAWAPADHLGTAGGAGVVELLPGLLTQWHPVTLSSAGPSGAGGHDVEDARSLAFAGCTGQAGSPCTGAAVVVATSEGLFWIPAGDAGASPELIPSTAGRPFEHVVALPLDEAGTTTRILASSGDTLTILDRDGAHVEPAVPAGQPQAGSAILDLRLTRDPQTGEPSGWMATSSGLFRIDGVSARDPSVIRVSRVTGTGTEEVTAIGVAPNSGTTTFEVWAGGRRAAGSQVLLQVQSPFGPSPQADVVVPAGSGGAPAIPDLDPFRYSDVPADAAHTRTGAAGRVELGYGWDGGSVRTQYERVDAGFLPINDPTRRDFEAWTTLLRHRVSPVLRLELEHADRRTSEPDGSTSLHTYSDRAALDWVLPVPPPVTWASSPALRLEARRVQDDYDAAHPSVDRLVWTRSLTVRESLLHRRLTVSGGYEQVQHAELSPERAGRSYTVHNVVGDVLATFGEGVTLALRYRRPLKVAGDPGGSPEELVLSGSEEAGWNVSASRAWGPLRSSLTLDDQAVFDLAEQGRAPSRRQRQATLAVTAPAVAWGAWSLSPSSRLSWSYGESTRTLANTYLAGAGLQARFAPASLEVSGALSRQLQDAVLPSPKTTQRDRLELSASTIALPWARLVASVSQQGERVAATLSGASGQSTPAREQESRSASLRLEWTTAKEWSQTTGLAWRESHDSDRWQESRGYELHHSARFSPGGPWSVGATVTGFVGERSTSVYATPGSAPAPEWRAELQAEAAYRFSSRWQAGLEIAYRRGTPPLLSTTALTPGAAAATTGRARLFVRASL